MEAPVQPKPGLSIQDILFILFRHKWKIIFFTLLGFIAAGVIWFTQEPIYFSRAKLLVRYVTENRVQPDGGTADVIKSPEGRYNTVLNSEIAILTSQDSLIETARDVGAARILSAAGGGTNVTAAAGLLNKYLSVSAGRGSSIITVTLGHLDAAIAQEALDSLIQNYLRKHFEVHRSGTTYDFLQAQTDQLKNRLTQTERELANEKAALGILSVAQAKGELYAQVSSVRNAIFEAETQIAEQQIHLEQLAGTPSASPGEAEAEPGIPQEAGASPGVDDTSGAAARLYQQLTAYRDRESELLLNLQETSAPVQNLRTQIERVETALRNRGLDPASPPLKAVASGASGPLILDPAAIQAQIQVINARLSLLNRELTNLLARGKSIDAAENTITTLERQKEMDETKLRYFYDNLERARIDQALDATKLNNITSIEEPTMTGRDLQSLYKHLGIALGAGIGFGLLLALVNDLFLDTSVKRPKELEVNLRLPVFAAIPSFARNQRSRRKLKQDNSDLQHAHAASLGLAPGEIVPWDENDPMLPYYEALRDRVVMSYNGDTHKPKIVGVTSCSRGAGVTRLSLGLAAALSRDAERNVLFIALERNKVSLTAFAKGVPREALPLQPSPAEPPSQPDPWPASRDSQVDADEQVTVQKNLVSLATTGRNLAGASIVQSFSDLMPKLKGADYDYIIFDLPPITQTSGSLRLATQMERTLMVVEAEKTHKDKVARARKLINGAPTQLFTVLNKTKSYGPKSLDDAI